MTIIVTGGAGFIGSNFIFYMLDSYPEDRMYRQAYICGKFIYISFGDG